MDMGGQLKPLRASLGALKQVPKLACKPIGNINSRMGKLLVAKRLAQSQPGLRPEKLLRAGFVLEGIHPIPKVSRYPEFIAGLKTLAQQGLPQGHKAHGSYHHGLFGLNTHRVTPHKAHAMLKGKRIEAFGKGLKPRLANAAQVKIKCEGPGLCTHGGKVGKTDSQSLMAQGSRIDIRKVVPVLHQRIGRHHKLLALRYWGKQRGIIPNAKRLPMA